MPKSHEYLTQRMNVLEQLRKLKKVMDPASGVSVMIRRGPLSQDDEGEERNQWIGTEIGVNMDELLDLLIANQQVSLKHWMRTVREDIASGQAALEEAGKVTLDQPTKKT